jgi:hypothetical protein
VFPGAGRDLEKEETSGRDQLRGLREERLCVASRESQSVPEHDHLVPSAGSERRAEGIPSDPIGARSIHSRLRPHAGQEVQHLAGDVEGHPMGPRPPDEREETAGTGPEVEYPTPVDRVASEEPLAQFSVEVSLAGAFVA